ncbi:MAG TPA: thioredoxin family protein [Kofleriaceae bacterium]|nr:thioredoxin family protein [Kofleriaceae bacterium]
MMSPSAALLPVVDDAGFLAATAGPGLVLIDFFAAWCGPCHAMAPVLAQLADSHRGRARVIAVDVDTSRALAQQFRVVSMPTLVLWRDGREVGRIVGARPARFISGAVARALAGEVAVTGP